MKQKEKRKRTLSNYANTNKKSASSTQRYEKMDKLYWSRCKHRKLGYKNFSITKECLGTRILHTSVAKVARNIASTHEMPALPQAKKKGVERKNEKKGLQAI